MTEPNPDLDALLAGEIERRLGSLEPSATPAEARATLHSLRGACALAGHHDLALVLAQLSARLRGGDESARAQAHEILNGALARLGSGRSPFATHWPEPPPGLGPSRVEPRYRAEYSAAMRDRLGEIDEALAGENDLGGALERAYRSVHGMKGAAASIGDDVTAWYCHGLETELKRSLASRRPRDALVELARHRAVIAVLLEQPERAPATLAALALRRPAPSSGTPSAPPSHPPGPEPVDGAPEQTEALLRVPAALVDGFLERLERMDLAHDELNATAEAARQLAARMRDLRASLLEALRLIGPPRPWGAPAAALERVESAARKLGAAADNAERGALVCRKNAETLHAGASEMRLDVAALRRATVGWLFQRVAHSVERLAEQESRLVRVETSGADLPIDRRIAERLLDPLMQLARNAVAHGIGPPEQRARAGKPETGVITLRAELLGDWLRVEVEDDGRGVDSERIRRLAVESGAVTAEAAAAAHEDELLALLFLPGLTTREGADLLAGRGVGLDLAQNVVRHLGGAIRLGSRPGTGLIATIEVPSVRGMVDVLWLSAGNHRFALPVSFAGRVVARREAERAVSLLACLGLGARRPSELGVELTIHGVQPIVVGVDAVGEVEEVGIRVVPPLIAASGPYSGAILRGDGSLYLALDAALLAARAWSHVA